MIAALDSSFDRPSPAQAAAAYTAGVRAWGGYLATGPGVGLASPWDRASFQVVQDAGMRAIAFCSGRDDPVALRQLAAQWGVLLVLDDEDGIRPLTSPDWRPAFLAASGAGLYGLLQRHDIAAPFRIAALYPAGGCTGSTWPTSPAPPEPHGWQCQGTHSEFGLSVDRSALDDWFGGEMTQEEHDALMRIDRNVTATYWEVVSGYDSDPSQGTPARYGMLKDFPNVVAGVAALEQAIAALPGGQVQLQPVLDAIAQLAAAQAVQAAAIARIEAALRGA